MNSIIDNREVAGLFPRKRHRITIVPDAGKWPGAPAFMFIYRAPSGQITSWEHPDFYMFIYQLENQEPTLAETITILYKSDFKKRKNIPSLLQRAGVIEYAPKKYADSAPPFEADERGLMR